MTPLALDWLRWSAYVLLVVSLIPVGVAIYQFLKSRRAKYYGARRDALNRLTRWMAVALALILVAAASLFAIRRLPSLVWMLTPTPTPTVTAPSPQPTLTPTATSTPRPTATAPPTPTSTPVTSPLESPLSPLPSPAPTEEEARIELGGLSAAKGCKSIDLCDGSVKLATSRYRRADRCRSRKSRRTLSRPRSRSSS